MSAVNMNYRKGLISGTALGILLQFGGYLLVRGGRHEFGWAIFCAVPFLSGCAVAAMVRYPKRITACVMTALITTLTLLLFIGLEGIICCLMSLPLIGGATALGAVVGYQLRGRYIDRLPSPAKTTMVLILIVPFLMAAADRIERPYRASQEKEMFTTETFVPVKPDRAWELLVGSHAVGGEKPLLLWAGLPNPIRCELELAGVGGRRVCYFDSGSISQEITVWNKPERMEVKVIQSTLPGRLWLSFLGASYEFRASGSGTLVTRHTTIGTHLYPRWYWRPLERWGVTSEHAFVFANLQRRSESENK